MSWFDMLKDGDLVSNGASSLYRAFAGLALAIVVGGALGIVMAWWKPANVLLSPLVEIFYPLPKSALIPVTVIWLGFGDGSKILLIFLGCMLPVTRRRFQRRTRERTGAGLVGAQHGREPPAHVVGRRAAERHAGTAQRRAHGAGALLHSAGGVGVIVAQKGFGYLIGSSAPTARYDAMYAVVLTVAF